MKIGSYKITFSFLWYDFWIGWFYDRKKKHLYLCPLPMCVLTIVRLKYFECGGGVVLNPDGEVCVVNQRGNSWALPKGHLDPGEDALAAAKREIKEEAGISDLTLIKELGSYERHKIGKDPTTEDRRELKRYTFFLFTTEQTRLTPEDPHNPEAKWVPREEVAAMLTHPKDAAFFEQILDELP